MFKFRTFVLVGFIVLFLTACTPPASTPSAMITAEPSQVPSATQTEAPTEAPGRGLIVIEKDKLYLAIIWHQHQPVYFKDPQTDVYQRPWVRVHAAKDYVDMAAMLEQYPDIRATFNLTPSLIRQLDDIAAGTKDLYWIHTEIPAEELSDAQKTFLLERFFDTNRKIIARFPRYQELLDRRDEEEIETAVETWAPQDFRDLQVLFNLAWTDPAWLAEPPLDGLVEQGHDFDEEDKQIVLDEHLRLVQEVIPLHAELQESGQIEVTMTPFAHPILPLLVDSDLAAVAMPDAELPPRFVYGQDAVAQVEKGIEFYRRHFNTDPRGMWPAEGSVAEEIVSMVANAGIEWIATDEDVLAGSLPEIDDFTRDQNDVVQQAEALYQPYQVQGARGGPVAILFRDKLISDMVGFQYSGMEGQAAADDFIGRLEAIQAWLEEQGSEGPHLVTVLLDGENAWEHYDNDGKAFLHGLYANLSENEDIVTVTPSEYLDALAELEGEPEMIEELWPGSWIDGTFSTWIGEEEENLAWEYLKRTRDDLQDVLIEGSLDEQTQADVLETMYIAEGSDWFWWYGADQNSGNDESFDQQYRNYLEQVYTLSGQEVPSFVDVPVIPQSAQPPDQHPQAMLTDVTADGTVEEGEWDGAGYYALDQAGLSQLSYGFDQENLYLRLDAEERIEQNRVYAFYLNIPGADQANAYTRYGEGETFLGFGVNRLVEITFPEAEPVAQIYSADGQGGWEPFGEQPEPLDQIALGDGVLELVLPFSRFAPDVRSGNQINFRLVVSESQADLAVFPPDGPVLATVPDLPIPNVFLDVSDPQGDDGGPGTYTYPEDAVFTSGAYDITGFTAGRDEEFYIFRVQFRGPVENPWDSPNGLSIQTIDIYIDTDGGASGDRILLPGRNAALTEGHAWNYAIWAEGWTPGIYQPGEDAPVEVDGGMEIITNPGQRRVTISVPIRLLPEGDPASWSFAVTLLSQEGFPAPGVWRVRDVQPEAEQWRIGGGTGSNLDTRILDVLWPETAEGSQQTYLENPRPGEDVQLEQLSPDQYPQVPTIVAP